jgi:cation:H+ antiporter
MSIDHPIAAMELMSVFPPVPIYANICIFVVLAGGIWIAGNQLSRLADAIGERTRIGGALMGLLFLAGITSLPELVTTVTASLKGDAALALNNGIVMQTAILAVADAVVRHASLTSLPPTRTPVIEGVLLIFLLTTLLGIISVGEVALFDGIGVGVVVLAGLYAVLIFALRRYEKKTVGIAPGPRGDEMRRRQSGTLGGLPLRVLLLRSAASGVGILVCGILVVDCVAAIADQSGLGSSFIGVTLLATSTSLPELSTTIAAVRLGAHTMAISNIFGSNLIMVVFILPADIFYREGEILLEADGIAQLALVAGIFVTVVYVAGLLAKRKPQFLGMGVDSMVVLGTYLISVYGFYVLR